MATKGKKTAANRGGSNLKPFYVLLGVIAMAGLGVIAWTVMNGSKAASEPVQIAPEKLKDVNQLVKEARGIENGQDNAPVRILVFSDYMCPACKQFTTQVEPQLRNEFINTGKVQLVYYDYPLGGNHRWSFLASRAGRCAEDQNKFWEFHDHLFAKQNDWSFSTSAPTRLFENFAQELKLDVNAFKSCLNSEKHADLVSANYALGTQLGVTGTPMLFMNGKHLPREWADYRLLRERVVQELGGAAPAPATTSAQ